MRQAQQASDGMRVAARSRAGTCVAPYLGSFRSIAVAMPGQYSQLGSPEQFVVEVFSELGCEVVQNRWRDVNVILRLSMLVGLDMQMEATLNMIGDFAADVATHDAALIYFWDEDD